MWMNINIAHWHCPLPIAHRPENPIQNEPRFMSAVIQHGSSPASCQVCLELELEPSSCCTSGVFYESFHGVSEQCTTNLPLTILHTYSPCSGPCSLLEKEPLVVSLPSASRRSIRQTSPSCSTVQFGVDRWPRVFYPHPCLVFIVYANGMWRVLRHGAFCSVTVLHLPVLAQEERIGLILMHLNPHCTPGVPIQSTAKPSDHDAPEPHSGHILLSLRYAEY